MLWVPVCHWMHSVAADRCRLAEERVNDVMGCRSAEISISLEMLCSCVTFCNQL